MFDRICEATTTIIQAIHLTPPQSLHYLGENRVVSTIIV